MFDPYEKWLRIPKDQRPVDYFLLLDVDPEERDPEIIRKAASRQAARVSPHQDGPHARECARLLKEIEQGRETLIKPSKRKAYEELLRKSDGDKAGRVEEVEDTEEDDPPRRAPGKNKRAAKPSRKSPKPEKTSRTWLWVALGSAAACLLLGIGVTVFLMMRPKKTAVPAQSGPVASAPEQPAPTPPAPKKEKDGSPPKEPNLNKEPAKQPPKPPPAVVKAPPPPLSRPAAAKPPLKIVKIPVPDSSAQEKAEKALKDTYKADYAKTKPEDSLALAAKLLQPGRENRSDPAAWFVLLREARDAAVRAGRSRMAIEAANEIDKWFIVDALAIKLEVLAKVSETPEGARAATKTALAQVEPALDADNYPAALRLVAAAEAAARKTKVDDKQLADIATRRGQVQGFERLYELIPAAREKLRSAPADANANLLVGKHLCLFQGRWDEGLPLLAKGGKEDEANLARLDLTPPADLKAQVAAGDGWWRLAQGHIGRKKWNLQERALAWYELAAPKVAGEDRLRLTERIVEGLRASAERIPRLLPGSFLGRNDLEDRTLLLREGGGTMRSEEAVEKGLLWLSQHQAVSGKWATDAFHKVHKKCNCTEPGQKFDVGGTAFGLLPFLGAGQTHRRGRYVPTVKKGLTFLLSQQKPEGKFSDNAYENALATIAVCEAYGQTKDKLLGVRAQLAVNFIVRAQHSEGSWGYSPGQKGDTSVSGWQFSALKAGHFAGLVVPYSTFIGMSAFLDQVADPGDLGYGYNSKGAGRSTSATGLLCREFLGWGPRHPIQARGIKQLLLPENFVTKNKPSIYFIFYATQAIHHAGGEEWESWNPRVRELLIELQDQGAENGQEHQKGSWSPRGDEWAVQGGRLMFTALALLTLEVYYYHIPLNGFGPAVLHE